MIGSISPMANVALQAMNHSYRPTGLVAYATNPKESFARILWRHGRGRLGGMDRTLKLDRDGKKRIWNQRH